MYARVGNHHLDLLKGFGARGAFGLALATAAALAASAAFAQQHPGPLRGPIGPCPNNYLCYFSRANFNGHMYLANGVNLQNQMKRQHAIARVVSHPPPIFKSVINATEGSFCTYGSKDVIMMGGIVGVSTSRIDARSLNPNLGNVDGEYVIYDCPQSTATHKSFRVLTPFHVIDNYKHVPLARMSKTHMRGKARH